MNCDSTHVGSASFGRDAQGVFCVVSLSVENIGNKAQTFSDSSQYAFDGQNRKFSTDTASAIYMDDSKSFLNQINPGSKVNGKIVFDVPQSTKLTKLELHDSPFSGGAKVSLG